MAKTVEQMRADGWPLRIVGNGGYKATLVECQPLFGGDCCHDLAEIKRCFTVLEQ